MNPSPQDGSYPSIGHGHKSAQRLILQIISAWRTQALYAAVQLGVVEVIAEKPQSAAELATRLQCNLDGLTRLLRALCSLDICQELPDGRFNLTQSGQYLREKGGKDGFSLRALALWWGGPLWSMWEGLQFSVKTGESARQKMTGDAGYQHLARNPESAQIFHEAMRGMTALILEDIVSLKTWSEAHTLVDVGGGHGQLTIAILASQSQLQGTVFDLPHAESGAAASILAAHLQERCQFKSGSFFESIPAGADRYLLKSILHNWDDEKCARILSNCRNASARNSKLLLVERIRPERITACEHDEGMARTDLNMLAGLGGHERTLNEFSILLSQAHFEIEAVTPTSFEFGVIEARISN